MDWLSRPHATQQIWRGAGSNRRAQSGSALVAGWFPSPRRWTLAMCTPRPDLPARLTPLNIGSPSITTVGEMAQSLTRALNGPDPVITGRYRLGDVRHITADCSAAERVLGWRADIGLDAGIRSLLATGR